MLYPKKDKKLLVHIFAVLGLGIFILFVYIVVRDNVTINRLLNFQFWSRLENIYAYIWSRLGNICAHKGNYKAAIGYYRIAADFKPDSASIHYSLGACYYNTGDWYLAKESFKKVIQLDPKKVNAYLWLGMINMYTKCFDNALKILNIAQKIEPANPKVYFSLGQCYFHMEEYSKATQYYKRAISIDSNYISAYWGLSMSYYKLDQWSLVKKYLLKYLTFDPQDVAGNFHLAESYFQLKEFDKALKQLDITEQLARWQGYSLLQEKINQMRAQIKSSWASR